MSTEVGKIHYSLNLDDSAFQSKINKVSGSISDVGKQLGDFGGQLTKNVTLPIIAAGTSMVLAFAEVEKAQSTIVKGTGASGQALEDMMDVVRRLAVTVPQGFGDIGTAVAEVNTRLGVTGEELQRTSKRMLDFARITNTDVQTAVTNVGRVFNALELDIEGIPDLLDKLTFASQKTGIGANDLINFIIDAGPAFEELGFGLDESIALFSQFEAAGARPQEVISSINILLTRMAREGVTDGREAMALLTEQIKEAPNIFAATEIAADAFGAKVGAKVAEDIRNGRFEIEDFVAELQVLDGVFEDTAETSLTFTEELAMLKNETVLLLEPLGKELVKVLREDLMPLFQQAIEFIGQMVSWFSNLDDKTKKQILAFIGLVAILGPLLVIVSKVIAVVAGLVKGVGILIAIIKGAILVVGGIIAVLGGPLTLIILAVIAVVVALALAWQNNLFGIRDHVNNFINWIKAVPDRIRNIVSGIPDIFKTAFRLAVRAVAGPIEEVVGMLNRLNPFHRQSPSLIDNITKGIGVIKKEYAGLANVSLPTAPQMAGIGTGGGSANVTINIDRVNDMADVDMLGRELGFRAAIV